MKKTTLTIVCILMTLCSALAGDHVVERTYVSTDRDVYVAGDALWCSAFCLDANHGNLYSDMSSVVYLELHSAEGFAAGARLALIDGRGAGKLMLPATLPTGNYRLIAYTAQNKGEQGYDYEGIASKTISVFNVFTKDRVKDGVEVVSDAEYKESVKNAPAPQCGNMALSVGPSAGKSAVIPITLTNKGAGASVSVAVYHEDGIAGNANPTIENFISASEVGDRNFSKDFIPDYEGEVVKGRITGFSADKLAGLAGKFAFISVPSEKSDVYAAVIKDSGDLNFYTCNIYGTKDMICEIEGIDSTLNCHLELKSPYVEAGIAAPSRLKMAPAISDALLRRSSSMQIEKQFASDTLFEYLPVRENMLFTGKAVQYILDDYTRFPVMEEVFIEFIEEIKARRTDGKADIRVRLDNYAGLVSFSKATALMMLDGVPVFDHSKILAYDPLLVESVNIYPAPHYIGARQFDGLVNFVTYKKNLPDFKFSNNARVINYQGVSYPEAYTCLSTGGNAGYPDYRQTALWQPIVNVAAGESVTLNCKIPAYAGRFAVVVEGLAADGTPIYKKTYVEVK